MSLYLQGEIWWYGFTIEGQRYDSSTRTNNKDLAQRVEDEHYHSLKRGGVKLSPALDAIRAEEAELRRKNRWGGAETGKTLPDVIVERISGEEYTVQTLLRDAGKCFIASFRDKRKPKSIECMEAYLRRLVEFFGDVPLKQFTLAHFVHYQSVRGAKCGASAVNHELNLLSRILGRVDLWWPIKKKFSNLKEAEWKKPRIFTADEQERIFRALKVNPNLELANIALTITRNTTASGCELRGLRISSLELEADPPRIHIPPDSTKNSVRPRTIPLNEDALRACKLALERAEKLGSHYPTDYLFPLCVKRNKWDPRRPTSENWLAKQMPLLREVTGIDDITPHTFRHLAVTELLERGASEETVVALAGWVGRKMFEVYSHPRLEAKTDAVRLLEGDSRPTPRPAALIDLEEKILQVQEPKTINGLTEQALERMVERRAEQMFNRWLERQAPTSQPAPQMEKPCKATVQANQLSGGRQGYFYF